MVLVYVCVLVIFSPLFECFIIDRKMAREWSGTRSEEKARRKREEREREREKKAK